MKYFRIILPVLALALCSCKSEFELLMNSNDVESKYKGAFELYDKGSYQKAAQLFESLSMLTSGTERDDTVQYYLAMSNYRQKDYFTAETNFQHFLQNFPRSAFAPSASYLRIDCLYKATNRWELDQKPTYLAMTAINEYLIDNPGTPHRASCDRMLDELNERLDRKAFENAKIYYTMEDYKAARVALRNVLKDDAENRYREDVMYYTAMASYKYAKMSVEEKQRERLLTFQDDYFNFIGEFPESKYRKELDTIFNKVKNNETSAK